MKTKEFIYKEVENYLKSNMSANRFFRSGYCRGHANL